MFMSKRVIISVCLHICLVAFSNNTAQALLHVSTDDDWSPPAHNTRHIYEKLNATIARSDRSRFQV